VDDQQEKLARIARDTMMELVSRGMLATPPNFERVFADLCTKRGVAVQAYRRSTAPPAPVDFEGAAEVAGLLFALADFAREAAAHSPDVRSLTEAVKGVAGPTGGFDATAAVALTQRLDRMLVEFGAKPELTPAGHSGPLLRRVAEVCRGLVPLADPEGQARDAMVAALAGLAQANTGDDAQPHFDAIVTFVAQRRKALAAELATQRNHQRRLEGLVALVDLCAEHVVRVGGAPSDLEASVTTLRARLPDADARGLQELRTELSAQLARVEMSVAPVQAQRNVVKTVLKSLADQLALATHGSAAFETAALQIRQRLENATEMTELRELQDLLVSETVNAAAEASKMRAQLSELSSQVSTSQAQIDTLERKLVETTQVMNIDPLTRVPNRRAMAEWVESTLYPEGRPERGFSVLVLDLDHFKHVNDTYGHLAGDAVLQETAKRVKLGIREVDMLARYGGEEFVLVLPECDAQIARAVAERMVTLVNRKPVIHSGLNIAVTTSIGVGTKRPGEQFKEVFERADQCVYRAKAGGRNRAVTEAELALSAP